MDWNIVIIMALGIMLYYSNKEKNETIEKLNRYIFIYRRNISILEYQLANTRMFIRTHPQRPQQTSNVEINTWKEAWAREVLSIDSGIKINDSVLKAARREAIKRDHPDKGGHADRIDKIERAVRMLS